MFGSYLKRAVCFGALILTAATAVAQGEPGYGRQRGAGIGNGSCAVASIPLQTLQNEERNDLLRIREEEKLARDVYLRLYEEWSDPVFFRISRSEQRHMDAVGVLLYRYGIEDPVLGNGEGEFSDSEIQNIYLDLVAMGGRSYVDGLRVGAIIEDLDLFDLREGIASTDNEDIKIVFENLQNGSGNHLRAFVGKLEALGESYTPQYMDGDALSLILASKIAAGAGTGRRGRNGGGLGKGTCARAKNAVTP